MSEDVPTYGEAIMNAVGAEAQAVLAFMADVQKMRALSAELGAVDPVVAEETRKLNLQIARSLRRQRKLLQEFLDRSEARTMIESWPQNICGWLSVRKRI